MAFLLVSAGTFFSEIVCVVLGGVLFLFFSVLVFCVCVVCRDHQSKCFFFFRHKQRVQAIVTVCTGELAKTDEVDGMIKGVREYVNDLPIFLITDENGMNGNCALGQHK